VADSGNSFVRPRRIPLVSSLASAIFAFALDLADHRVDREHYSHLRHVAFACIGAAVGGASGLGDDSGIRMRGSGRNHSRGATDYAIGRNTKLGRLATSDLDT
jgi:hypothetical protein